jgi:radical SAM protein with 4Fe4S-binding SPASM domain
MMNFYKKNGYSEMQIGRKEPLWVLVDPISFHQKNCNCGTEKNIVDGCSLGTLSFTVLPNGEVIGCRRHLGSLIGKVPEQSFREIFLNSRRLNDLRKFEKIEKCNKCKWLYHCRGCRAVAYGRSKTIYSPDPQCWLEK